jgi:AcrR family transcriptional regulator
MPRDAQQARNAILDAAERLLRHGSGGTIDEVAHEAHCAKGLVHYHFRTKSLLLAAVASQLANRRNLAWAAAFEAHSPDAAIRTSWELLLKEHLGGELRAWVALLAEPDPITGHTVSTEMGAFAAAITEATGKLLASLGLRPTVPVGEIGRYLAAVIQGMSFQLAAGGAPEELQGAYAAAWLGALSLARPVAG